jgi:hypothetical protein
MLETVGLTNWRCTGTDNRLADRIVLIPGCGNDGLFDVQINHHVPVAGSGVEIFVEIAGSQRGMNHPDY